MRNDEISRLYTQKGYKKELIKLVGIDILYKDKGNYIAAVIVVNNMKNLLVYKENTKALVEVCKTSMATHHNKKIEFLTIICEGDKFKKGLLNMPDVCIYTNKSKLALGKEKNRNLIDEYRILKFYNKKTINRNHKVTAFMEEEKIHAPFVVYIIVFCTCALYIMSKITEKKYLGDSSILGISPDSVISGKEYIRLITYMFAHSGIFHLIYNVIALLSFGSLVEEKIGSVKFTILYIYGGISAGIISVIAHKILGETSVYTVGASGAIYALVGALTVYMIKNAIQYGESIIRILLYELILIGSGFLLQNIDNYAHIGGYSMGVIIALIYILVMKIMQYIKYLSAIDIEKLKW